MDSSSQPWNVDASDFIPLSASMDKKGQSTAASSSKKKRPKKKGVRVDATSLVNFQYSQERYVPNEHIAVRKKPVQHVPFDKEQFMQANFRVCINRIENPIVLSDPDYVSPWTAIDLMIYPVSEDYKCPICLETELVAEQMSRCGHVFCWPCLIRYKATTNKPWIPCPLCGEPIRLDQLTSVKLEKQTAIKEGETVDMNLMVRGKSSIIPFVANSVKETPGKIFQTKFPKYEDSCHTSRICVLSDKTETLIKERAALESAKEYALSLGDMEGIQYIEQAIEYLCVKEATYIDNQQFSNTLTSQCHGANKLSDIEWNSELVFYYYQIANGENYFLDQLDTKILLEEYGDYSQFPETLKVVVNGINSHQQDPELRKRHKKIQYLPLNAFIYLLEVDIKSLVSEGTYKKFKKEVEGRDRARKKKTETEDKNKKRHDRYVEKKFYASMQTSGHQEWTGVESGAKDDDLVNSGTFAFNWPGIAAEGSGQGEDTFDDQYLASLYAMQNAEINEVAQVQEEEEPVEEFPALGGGGSGGGDYPELGSGAGRKKSGQGQGKAKKRKDSDGPASWSGLFDGSNPSAGQKSTRFVSGTKSKADQGQGQKESRQEEYSDDEDGEYDKDYVASGGRGVNAYDHMYVMMGNTKKDPKSK